MDRKALVVDDDEKLRKLVREYLEGYGFKVLTLVDGSAVPETIERESPDIVILDIMMPVKDGLDVLKEIRMTFDSPRSHQRTKVHSPEGAIEPGYIVSSKKQVTKIT